MFGKFLTSFSCSFSPLPTVSRLMAHFFPSLEAMGGQVYCLFGTSFARGKRECSICELPILFFEFFLLPLFFIHFLHLSLEGLL